MPPLFIDCPPFLKELYEEGLSGIVPDLEIHLGDPAGEELVALCAGRSHILNDHSRFTAAILERYIGIVGAAPDEEITATFGWSPRLVSLAAARAGLVRARVDGGEGWTIRDLRPAGSTPRLTPLRRVRGIR